MLQKKQNSFSRGRSFRSPKDLIQQCIAVSAICQPIFWGLERDLMFFLEKTKFSEPKLVLRFFAPKSPSQQSNRSSNNITYLKKQYPMNPFTFSQFPLTVGFLSKEGAKQSFLFKKTKNSSQNQKWFQDFFEKNSFLLCFEKMVFSN